jgi:hypothetical protein
MSRTFARVGNESIDIWTRVYIKYKGSALNKYNNQAVTLRLSLVILDMVSCLSDLLVLPLGELGLAVLDSILVTLVNIPSSCLAGVVGLVALVDAPIVPIRKFALGIIGTYGTYWS